MIIQNLLHFGFFTKHKNAKREKQFVYNALLITMVTVMSRHHLN